MNPFVVYSDSNSSDNDKFVELFPIPLLVSPYPFNYNKELKWIINHECKRKNRGGNRQSEDTFILDRPELVNIRKFIEAKIEEYLDKIYKSDNKLVITQSWLNKNKKGESHHDHNHPNSMISGVWYPQIDEKLPPIKFTSDTKREISLGVRELNYFNSPSFILKLNRGELILFPSNLRHSVPENKFDQERISLSFNTWPKGSLGNIDSLTYIPLDRCV